MANMKTKPEIRFAEFTDAWEQRKLGDFVELYSGLTYSPKNVVSDGTLVLRSSNVKDGEIVDADNVYVQSECVNSDNVQIGDVIVVVRNGSRNLIGKHAQIKRVMQNTVIGAFMTGVRSKIPEFTNTLLDTQQFDNEIKKNLGATINQITMGEFKKMSFSVPGQIEQQKIGSLFANLDNLITLHQREYDKTVNIKKAMLEKMFPKNGEDKPEIRFKGFTDAWEQRKFEETFIMLKNNTLSRANLNYEYGTAKCVHYGDVLIKFGECLDVNKEELPYITGEASVQKYKASFLCDGDIIIADTAEDETVGKCCEIAGLGTQTIISGLHTIPCRPIENFATGFLGYYLNSSAYHNQLLPLMQGIKVTSISKSALQDTVIVYPKSVQEQAKIGEFFSYLDNLITLHQRELEKLQNMKKALLQKMFV
jgi:type I restriction enzyme S subunit